jgi:CPA2 family monovalent cation:H+ antiporter-2
MHEIPLLVNMAVALAAAFLGGVVARRLGLPTLVGYLLAGMAIGPFTPGFSGDAETIGQLAELGVIFLMFGVGLHFSVRDLVRVRRVAVPGAIAQMAVATALGYAVARAFGVSPAGSLVLGLAISVASTVVLLRGLADHGLLESDAGRIAVGWLVLEDIATVLLLLALPAIFDPDMGSTGIVSAFALAMGKASVFIALMLVAGGRVVPWLLARIARMRSRDLFLLLALTVSLGMTLAATAIFGVSLALGAFLAGVVVGQSPTSHQVGADVLPFREAFSVLFFVSVGMLVDPATLAHSFPAVLSLTALIVLGKGAVATLICAALGQPLRTALVVAVGLGQIGEFSFILARAGVGLGALEQEHYSILLASALLSITVNPLLFRAVGPIERAVARRPALARILDRKRPAVPSRVPDMKGHVVVVGCGRVGSHLVEVLGHLGVPRLVVELDGRRTEELASLGVPVIYGDAANSEILRHAHLRSARALVITVPDDAAATLAVAGALGLAPDLPILVRASSPPSIGALLTMGASDVIHPELEGGLEIVRSALLRLGYPLREVEAYAEAVRHERYDVEVDTAEERRALEALVAASGPRAT